MMARVERGEMTDLQAAAELGLSIRHTRRLLARYQTYGPGGLAHGNRARNPANAPDSSITCRAEGQASADYSSVMHSDGWPSMGSILEEHEGP